MKKKSNLANTVILIAIFVGVFLYNMVNPRDMVTFQVDESNLTLGGYEDIVYTIPLDTILGFTFVEEAQYPEETKSVLHGTYHNDQWGEHILYVNGKVSSCIVIESEHATYVFNYENESTTRSLYEALLELL